MYFVLVFVALTVVVAVQSMDSSLSVFVTTYCLFLTVGRIHVARLLIFDFCPLLDSWVMNSLKVWNG